MGEETDGLWLYIKAQISAYMSVVCMSVALHLLRKKVKLVIFPVELDNCFFYTAGYGSVPPVC